MTQIYYTHTSPNISLIYTYFNSISPSEKSQHSPTDTRAEKTTEMAQIFIFIELNLSKSCPTLLLFTKFFLWRIQCCKLKISNLAKLESSQKAANPAKNVIDR